MDYPADHTRHDHQPSRASAIAATARRFAELRHYLQRTPDQIAYRLHTDPGVVIALETGALHLLPSQAERHRIILGYAALAGIDGQPMWACVESLIGPPVPFQSPLSSPVYAHLQAQPLLGQSTAATPPAAAPTHWQGVAQAKLRPSMLQRLQNAVRPPVISVGSARRKHPRFAQIPGLPKFGARPTWRTAVAVTVVAAIAVTSQTSILQAGVNKLPSPVSRLVWGAHEAVMLHFVKRFEGLPWIDSDNPRARRADKVIVTKRTK